MSIKTLKASIVIGGAISGSLRSALSSTRFGLKAIGEEVMNVERRQRLLGRQINTFGRMGKNVDKMRREYAQLAREADKLRIAQARLAGVQERIEANKARRGEARGQFFGAAATFGVVAAASLAPVRVAVQFETAMLGVAKQLDGARDAAGNLTPVYFSMARQVQQLGRELPLATNDLADMVAAGLRMGVANDEVVAFTRTAAMMADAFEMPAGQLADDMGKIAGLFQIPIPRIGELADAINYLDDRSQAKGGEIIDVMQRIGGMARALKMPAREAAALGSTFVHLGSSAEVAGTASNAVLRILGAATVQSKRVRSGLASLGLNADGVQASMARDATGTILSVLDKLNALNTEQRMAAATRLFGAEYGDDVAKLATGAAEYRRQLALVRGEEAKGSMAREFNARLGTAGAQWEITKNRMREVSVVIGNALVPAMTRMMETAAPMIEGFANWSRENPRLIKGIVGSALALTGLRAATAGVAYAWTAVKGPVLSVMGLFARMRAAGALAALGRFGPVAMRIAGPLRAVGAAIAAIGAGPVSIAVGALTAGALIVRKYWQPIKAFMGGMFEGIRLAVGPAMAEIGAALAPLRPVWDGMANAIGKAWAWVVKLLAPLNLTSEELKGAAAAGRTFGVVLGAVIANGLRGFAALVRVIGWVIGKAATLNSIASRIPVVGTGALLAKAAFSDGPAPAGKRAPVRAGSARGRAAPAVPAAAPRGGVTVTDASSHTYNITQQPGESTEALARRIEAEQRRQAGVDRRGRLADDAA
ncbi:phage tail tape measure protein [Pseudoxanthomonas daejeonensis]|uniref:phage tail tape measure protein n=1 Tax=Pseudoxanthomonas daejeonensis TaxID=266062 RepID=UPI001F544338|nr:phage tail tape measure protein [Pseudoxanthomonas daejeonensis]UNK57162.1 phage tail tape measure protein [Pseudoxanthomonas daejeonensis]